MEVRNDHVATTILIAPSDGIPVEFALVTAVVEVHVQNIAAGRNDELADLRTNAIINITIAINQLQTNDRQRAQHASCDKNHDKPSDPIE